MRLKNQLASIASTPWKKTVVAMAVAHLVTSIGFSSIFPFLPLYVRELGTDTGLSIELLSGLVFSSMSFTMMIASPFWGSLADRLGRKIMVQRSMYGAAVITILMVFATRAEHLILLRATQGFITGTIAAGSALIASEVPRDRIGLGMGLIQTALGLGNALGPMIGGVIADLLGYHQVFYITAGLLFLGGVIVTIFVLETHKPVKSDKKPPRMLSEWKRIFSSDRIRIAYLVRFISQFAGSLVMPILSLFVLELMGADSSGLNTSTGLIIGLSSASMTIFAVYFGQLGDKIGHRKILLFSAGLAMVLYILQSFVTDVWQLVVLQVLVGVTAGGITPSASALLTNATQSGDEGTVFGIDNSIMSMARGISPMLGAAIATWFNLRIAFIAGAILYALMTAIISQRVPTDTRRNPHPESKLPLD